MARSRFWLLGLLAGLVLAVYPTGDAAAAPAWPMVRHDAAATGKSLFNGPNKPALRWSYTIGYYLSCPPLVAQDGTIYGIDDSAHQMHAVNPDGTRKWKVLDIGRGMALGPDGTIYAWCDWDGGSWPYLCAMNPADGKRKWTVKIGGTNGVAPVVGPDGTIYVTEQQYGKIHALNPADGSVKWDSEGDGLNSYQLALAPNGAAIYAGDAFIKIRSYNTADGRLGWTSDRTCEWPAVGADGTVYAVDNRTDGKCHLIALNPATGVTKWAQELNGDGGRPAISGTVIYVTTTADVSKLYAINGDGSVRFTYDIPGSTFPAENSLPIVDGQGRVYVAFDKGLIAVDPTTGEAIWWQQQGGYAPVVGFNFPVIGPNGFIYAGDPRYLNAIGPPDTPVVSSGWPMVRYDAAATANSLNNGPNRPSLRWSYTIGYYLSCPPLVAQNGTVYGIEDTGHEMHAVYPNGTRKWKVGNIGRGMALAQDGTIYAWCDWDGGSWPYLGAMNPTDGSRKWTVKIGGTNGVAPVVGPDGIIYVTEQQYGKIHALHPGDGSVKWDSEGDGLNAYQLALAPDGAAIYAGDAFVKIRSYNTADGHLGWTSDRTCEWPAVGADGTVYAVDNRTGGKFHLLALNPANGATRWFRELNGAGGRPAISGKVIYVTTWHATTGSKLYAINDDGAASSVRWIYDIPGSTFTAENFSPIVDGQGRVYVPFDKGLIAINPANGQAIWWQKQGGYAPEVGFNFPVIGPNGVIYAGDPRYLNAIAQPSLGGIIPLLLQ